LGRIAWSGIDEPATEPLVAEGVKEVEEWDRKTRRT
jgi:hypothetical protein